jgi:hypothetical protein
MMIHCLVYVNGEIIIWKDNLVAFRKTVSVLIRRTA